MEGRWEEVELANGGEEATVSSDQHDFFSIPFFLKLNGDLNFGDCMC